MWNKLKDFFELTFITCMALSVALFGLLFILICQPFFWLAIIAIVLIMNL